MKDWLHKTHNKTEDVMYTIIQKLPERMMPKSLMAWLSRYTDRRIQELQHQIVHDQWRNIALQKAADEIQARQEMQKTDGA